MLKKIAGTAGTRIINAVFTLSILGLFTNYVGSRGLGIIGLVVLDITILQLFFDLLAGNPLVYFSSRTSLTQLLFPAYSWIVLLTVVVLLIFLPFQHFDPTLLAYVVPKGYGHHILFLAVINGLNQVHYNLLIGQGRIKVYNILFTIQIGLVLAIFTPLVLANGSPIDYIDALYVSWGICAIVGFLLIFPQRKSKSMKGWKDVSKEVLRFGKLSFAANILHLGNKRLSFYFIKAYAGLPSLGIYNAGAQLTEGVRIIGQSISLVQYSVISGSRDKSYARTITLQLMKISVFLTFIALLVLLLIPTDIYGIILSKDFGQVKQIIVALFPGVLALSANTIFSHYFSGLGQPEVNLRSNVAGFVVTILFALLLIPLFGITGAAATASLSYFTSAAYQYIVFKKQTGTKAHEWLIYKADFRAFRTLVVEYFQKRASK